MLQHIVWWTLKPGLENRASEIQKASECLKTIEAAKSVYVTNKILSGTTVACQIVLVSTHEDEAALEAYKSNPTHVEFAKLVTEAAASRTCIDCYIM